MASNYGIKEILISNNIIDSENKIIKEDIFLDFIFGLFLYYYSYEKFKFFHDTRVRQKISSILKRKSKSFLPPHYPFRFIGVGDKTIFVGMATQQVLFLLFKEILQKELVESFSHLDIYLAELEKSGENRATFINNHKCEKKEGCRYCDNCKPDFSNNILSNYLEKFMSIRGVNSYCVLNVPAKIFDGIINEDDMIEIIQDLGFCECGASKESGDNFCPGCGKPIEKVKDNDKRVGNPEKFFNEAFGLYLGLKKGYYSYPNHELDSEFNNEMDVLLQKIDQKDFKIIEGTVALELNKQYVKEKIITLNLVDTQLSKVSEIEKKIKPSCNLILWSIHHPNDYSEIVEIPRKFFGDNKKFILLPSSLATKPSNTIGINRLELNEMRNAFFNITQNILNLI